ncbi:MAG: hypothetical protein JWR19_3682 [Pedosphaera sp.]|nr:hypothetical protein [Pedosphaera sp.]
MRAGRTEERDNQQHMAKADEHVIFIVQVGCAVKRTALGAHDPNHCAGGQAIIERQQILRGKVDATV